MSAAGVGVAALRRRLAAGGTALLAAAPWTSPEDGQRVDPGWLGRVPGAADQPMGVRADGVPQALCVAWGIAAVREALDDAGVRARVPAARIGLCIGTNLEDRPETLDVLADRIAGAAGIDGPRVVVSVACASATACFPCARDLLAAGDLDAVVVGGSDVLTPRVIAGFRLLGLIAPGPCAPFSAQLGTSLGEGAGFVVLERRAPCWPFSAQLGTSLGEGAGFVVLERRASAADWPEALLGDGLAADGHHPTAPEPQGRGTTAVIAAALRSAGLGAAAVDAVNAHATGTEANDDAEIRGIRRALGERADAIPITASKSILGHAQGAAGGLELVVALLARRTATIPPTVNFQAPARALAPRDPVAADAPRACAHDVVLSLSAGFGGANAAIVVGRARDLPGVRARDLRISAVCALTAAGLHSGPLARHGLDAVIGRRVVGLDWRLLVRGCDLRRKHPTTRFLTAAVAHALGPRGPRGATAGLIVGQRRVSPAALARVHTQIEDHGLLGATATAFAESLTVNGAGDCAAAGDLLGPFNVLCAGDAGGLLALVHAAGVLRRDPAVLRMVAAGVDECDDRSPEATPFEGAVAVVLGDAGDWLLRGVGVAGPGMADAVLGRALADAGLDRGALAGVLAIGDGRTGVEALPRLGASGGLLALAHGLARFAGPFAVVVDEPRAASCAVILGPADPSAD